VSLDVSTDHRTGRAEHRTSLAFRLSSFEQSIDVCANVIHVFQIAFSLIIDMSDFKAIGKAFIEFYYNKFDTGPREGVAALYVNTDYCLIDTYPCIVTLVAIRRNLPME
jgi:hypothetical protein